LFLRRLVISGALGLLAASLPGRAHADLTVRVDKSTQRMTVSVDGQVRHAWPVSTGRSGFGTPTGRFRPQRLARIWFSRQYYNSPMPHSIFFHEGYAIHGTNDISRLGGPASHGCVRLHPGHAATLFALVQEHGSGNTQIVVNGDSAAQVAHRSAPLRERRLARVRADNDGVPGGTIRYRVASPSRTPAYHDVRSGAPVYYTAPGSGTVWRYQNGQWY
jgi:hypothetical protein